MIPATVLRINKEIPVNVRVDKDGKMSVQLVTNLDSLKKLMSDWISISFKRYVFTFSEKRENLSLCILTVTSKFNSISLFTKFFPIKPVAPVTKTFIKMVI